MKIVVNDVKKGVNSLSNYIDAYENNYLNMCNLFSEAGSYWVGEKTALFFNKTDYEQTKININIKELKSLLNVYKYVVNEYSNIGNEIIANVKEREYVATYFNVYMSMISQIIAIYDNFPANYMYLVEDQRRFFRDLKQQLSDIKINLKSSCDKIERIESNVSDKISKIKFEVLKESDISTLL